MEVISEELLIKARDKVNSLLKSGEFRDRDALITTGIVAAYVLVYAHEGITPCHQMCMAQLRGTIAKAAVCHIQGGARTVQPMTDEEAIRYLQYLMDNDMFKGAFLKHNAEEAMAERMVYHDLNSLPANQAMWAITATRALWESPFSKVPSCFCKLVDAGLSPDYSYIMAHYLEPSGDGFVLSEFRGNSNHAVVSMYNFDEVSLRNFMKHKITLLAPGPISAGNGYTKSYGGGSRYSIFQLFKDEYECRDAFIPLKKILTDKLGNKQISPEQLKALEADYA